LHWRAALWCNRGLFPATFLLERHIEPILLYIVLATLAGGVLSVAIAGSIAVPLLSRWVGHMVSFAVGALLAVAFLDVLPEALSRTSSVQSLLATLLGGLLLFFILQKAALWRHSHAGEDTGHGHAHHHGHDHHSGETGPGTAAMILVGDSFHNFVDGVLVAAAFMVDARLGVATTTAVILHEIPQEIGDFMILLAAGFSRSRALAWNLVSGLASVAGGVLGYFLLDSAQAVVPYVLALAAASFIYVAMADLIPAMQRRWDARDALSQIVLISAGIAAIAAMHLLHD
jgi:zinc and cadmium transporter